MDLDKLLSAARKQAAEEKGKRRRRNGARPRAPTGAAVRKVLADGVDPDDLVGVIRAALLEVGFDSPGFDAMHDDEARGLFRMVSSIRQHLRKARREGRDE
jgi:hypothetical protein